MKTISLLLIAALSLMSAKSFAQKAKKDTTTHITYYSCPMHDSVQATKTGFCPICGMKLQLSKKEIMKHQTVKNYVCPVHPDITSTMAGKCSICGMSLVTNLTSKEKMKGSFTCPMHPDVISDKEGKCPKCGMALAKKKG